MYKHVNETDFKNYLYSRTVIMRRMQLVARKTQLVARRTQQYYLNNFKERNWLPERNWLRTFEQRTPEDTRKNGCTLLQN